MIGNLKITIAQINSVVGDLAGNTIQIETIWAAHNDTCDLIIFPEMVLTGYPVEDLVFRESFMTAVHRDIEAISARNKNKKSAVLIGAPWQHDGKLYNAAFLIDRGEVRVILKRNLPNDGVFDEERLFAHGPLPDPVQFRGHKLGIMICQDFWSSEVAVHLKGSGAECLIIPNGSTYETTKYERRMIEAKQRVAETNIPLLYMNMVGGQDELVFDGASFVMNQNGDVTCQMKAFEDDIQTVTVDSKPTRPYPETDKAMYMAAVIGLRDYIHKSGFNRVLLGLSGGIDSALVAIMAVDALGAEYVRGIRLPSRFTSENSMNDAVALAQNLSIQLDTIPITPAQQAFEAMMEDLKGLTHENMQARVRGVTLMCLSNASGALLLSTGNKSENAMGYATLYGDMCGAFNPLKDMYKTKVFELAHLRNQWKPDFAHGPNNNVIPNQIITKAPTAELRDNQKDEDALPPYALLDQILERMIEHEQSVAAISSAGFDLVTTEKIYNALMRSEYKRRQACPGVNLTTRAFGGRARRYPIVNKFWG